MAFDVKQKLKIELFEVCRIVALFHNREKERETERDRESNALMSCFKHVIVSCIKLYASASWSLQTMGCKAAVMSSIIEPVLASSLIEFGINSEQTGVVYFITLISNFLWKKSIHFFSWFYYILRTALQYAISMPSVS